MMRFLILFIHPSLPGYQMMPDPGRFGMYLRSMVFMIMGKGIEKTRDFSHGMNRTPLSLFHTSQQITLMPYANNIKQRCYEHTSIECIQIRHRSK